VTAAVIVAAGAGRRMGFDKLFAPLAGRPVLAHSIAAFEAVPEVDCLVVVAAAEKCDEVRALADAEGFGKVAAVVEGGPERHESVWNGVLATGDDCTTVAVHDAARPLVTPAAIALCLQAAHRHGAAVLAHRVTETLKRVAADGKVAEAVERDGLWAMETPQAFARHLLVEAYQRVHQLGMAVTDEASALHEVGAPVWVVENHQPNLKVTVPGDLAVAAAVLAARRAAFGEEGR
jgi:2-C-methyl-D-erythritol 4-phosphate cytidylyltransferase